MSTDKEVGENTGSSKFSWFSISRDIDGTEGEICSETNVHRLAVFSSWIEVIDGTLFKVQRDGKLHIDRSDKVRDYNAIINQMRVAIHYPFVIDVLLRLFWPKNRYKSNPDKASCDESVRSAAVFCLRVVGMIYKEREWCTDVDMLHVTGNLWSAYKLGIGKPVGEVLSSPNAYNSKFVYVLCWFKEWGKKLKRGGTVYNL